MWGCPAVLAEMTVKIGSLGMLAIGLCYLAAVRQGASPSISGHERIAVALCAYGLIAEIVTGILGYFIGKQDLAELLLRPGAGWKEHWLAVQGLSILVYFVGVCYSVAGVRRASKPTSGDADIGALAKLRGLCRDCASDVPEPAALGPGNAPPGSRVRSLSHLLD
jgi:hypothetical protein